MKFTAKGREYETDVFGVINQTDHKPFRYDPAYAAIYDKPEYVRESEKLQAQRYGFICAAHGRPINSLCEIGYGNGAFLKYVQGEIPILNAFDVTGVHIDGIYIQDRIVNADVLTAWDVIEHIADLSFIKDLPHETICLSLPYCHFMTEGKEWFENHYRHLKSDEHIHHFNELSLAFLMDSMGWKMTAWAKHEDKIRKHKVWREWKQEKYSAGPDKGKPIKSGPVTVGNYFTDENNKLQNILSMAFKRK